MFLSGELFEYRFDTEAGAIGFLAEVEIDGDTLHLKDIAVYPVGPAAALEAGTPAIWRSLRILEDLARQQGFVKLRITGQRLTGANPGANVDIERSLA
jgi:hypothetical protein